MNKLQKSLRLFAALSALALLTAGLPAASAEGGFQAVVAVDSMKVYAQKKPHALLGSLPRGTVVTVEDYSGSAALIRYNGKTGVALVADMTRAAQPDPAPAEAPQAEVRTVVALRDTRVYRKASTSSRSSAVKAGTEMQLLAVKGSCARVSLNGKVRYALYADLGEPGSAAQPEAPADEGETAVKPVNSAVVTTQAARVYSRADSTGNSAMLDKGTRLTLLAVRGDCAMVERSGAIGFTSLAYLKRDTGSSDAQPEEAGKRSNPFSSGSSEHAIYAFLTGNLGYNRAAAMGVMANIKYESSYRTDCNGDGGTSYGICQWHAGRKTSLINYCAENGLDYTALDGQLAFLKHELTTRYAGVHSYMKQVEDSAEGAYDAGYYFCFNFEAPAARTSQSTARGKYARDTLYAK